jgi:outer membrane protein OmpA-like peptidoglycan-associated protein
MKKQLLLIGLILGMFTAFSQEVTKSDNTKKDAAAPADTTATAPDFYCPHRIQLYLGVGYSNDIFTKNKDFPVDFQRKFSYTSMFRVGYAYLWQRKVNIGIGIGAGIAYTRPQVKYTDHRTVNVNDPGYNSDNGEARYDLTYATKDFKVRERIWAIEVPLTMQLEKKFGNQKHGIYFNVGVKGYFPISAKLDFPGENFDYQKIYDHDLNVTYTDGHPFLVHLDDQNLESYHVKTKMRCSIDALGEFGGVFGLSRRTDFYLGVYATYGFLNIYPKDGIDLSGLDRIEEPRLSQVLDNYVNVKDKWNLFQVGLKVGFHFKTCKECGNSDYMQDRKRKHMDEMEKKKNEPIIITNTTQEYYYVVPTIAPELLDESATDPAKKKALMELAQSLSNIKILFPLDSDVPQLDAYKYEHISKASELLRANPDLKVIVNGYTSPEGSISHNQDLGNRRAIAVRKEFLNRGVPEDQITIRNYTAEDPQHRQDIPEKDWKEQRAVIFRIEKR